MKSQPNQIKETANEFAISNDFIPWGEVDSSHISSNYLI
jgi:hypothetical protein